MTFEIDWFGEGERCRDTFIADLIGAGRRETAEQFVEREGLGEEDFREYLPDYPPGD